METRKTEIPENNLENLSSSNVSRRSVLKAFGALAALSMMPACMRGGSSEDPPATTSREDEADEEEQPPQLTSPEIPQEVVQWLANGRALRSEADEKMLNETSPFYDLAYFGNTTVARIREIQDPRQKIATAIGFLGVEEVDRYDYNIQKIYTCNKYALDLLRLLLGNGAIGSRYNIHTGQPGVVGLSQRHQLDEIKINYRELSSNMLDRWMLDSGVDHGWQKVNTQQELHEKLSSGYVGLAVTNYDVIQKEKAELEGDEQYFGHALVIFSVSDELLGISQATNNIRLKVFPLGTSYHKVDPEYINQEHGVPEMSFWVHKLD